MADLVTPGHNDSAAAPEIADPVDFEALDRWIEELTSAIGGAEFSPVQLRYGDHHPEQFGDLWIPPGEGPFATIVLIHGGGFLARFSRAIMYANVIDLVRRGFAVWCPEYRRTDLAGGPTATTADVESAIAYLHEMDEDLDLTRVAVIGHSAGGFLALWAARMPSVTQVIALGAVCDLRANALERGDGYVEFMGGLPTDVPESFDFLDLSRRPAAHAEQVLICGLDDQPHRIEENRRYASMATTRGDRVTLVELPRTGHFAYLDPRSRGWHQAMSALDSMSIGARTETTRGMP